MTRHPSGVTSGSSLHLFSRTLACMVALLSRSDFVSFLVLVFLLSVMVFDFLLRASALLAGLLSRSSCRPVLLSSGDEEPWWFSLLLSSSATWLCLSGAFSFVVIRYVILARPMWKELPAAAAASFVFGEDIDGRPNMMDEDIVYIYRGI